MMEKIKFKIVLGSLGDMQTEWWTDEDWDRWEKKCEEWIQQGVFGKEVEYFFLCNPQKELDWWKMMELEDKKEEHLPKESYKFIIFDVSNESKNNMEGI